MNWNQIFEIYISSIGGIGMFIATILLLILTYKYLKMTKKMINMIKEEFEIRTKPVIYIKKRVISISPTSAHLFFGLKIMVAILLFYAIMK